MSGWFTSVLEEVKKGADSFGQKAAELGENMKKGAVELGEKLKEQEGFETIKRHFELDPAEVESKLPPTFTDADAAWSKIPEGWQERGREWEILAKNLVRDDNTFLVGPCNRVAPSHINWERDVVPGATQLACADFEPMSHTRFRLVPKWVADRDFWENYVWKLREASGCKTLQQLEETLKTLNKDPKIPPLAPGVRMKNRGIAQETDVIHEIVELLKEEQATTKRINVLKKSIEDEVKTSEENAALLKRIIGRSGTGSADLKESVYESCKYHKQKVGQLLQQVEEEDPSYRKLLDKASLEQAMLLLDAAVDLYENGTRPESPASVRASPEPASAAARTAATEVTPPAPAPPAASPSPASPSSDTQPKVSENYFNDPLPWEEEEG